MNNLPEISGHEDDVSAARTQRDPVFVEDSDIEFTTIKSGFSNALHMHQPLVPEGGDDLQTARVIGHLQYMMEHQDIGDNHNAPVFRYCYKRMGEFIPQLVDQGHSPRIMLDYSGCLLFGLEQMGADDVIAALRHITTAARYRRCVEWLGTAWGHPVAPSTPVQDFRLHVDAWQQHFLSLFGCEALSRVRGFSPPEMALPNHPDVAFEFVKTLRECGYEWVLVQEHTVEQEGSGEGVRHPHLPHRLVARNSQGAVAEIIAIVKTQGSDTKLVAQMQPYYEAQGLTPHEFSNTPVPPIVTQIGDGENGGVMMNEFPDKYKSVMAEASGTDVPPLNVSEYLEFVYRTGVDKKSFPTIQPIMQQRIWDRVGEDAGPERMEKAIEDLKKEDDRFHMQGGSWTNNISWVKGYDDVLGPMERASSEFHEKVLKADIDPREDRYRNALFHLLISQTSCYRYWGEGRWTDYGKELCRRTLEILENDFS
ncbi:MAG: glycosyl hydrolase family 57 [bacterium]